MQKPTSLSRALDSRHAAPTEGLSQRTRGWATWFGGQPDPRETLLGIKGKPNQTRPNQNACPNPSSLPCPEPAPGDPDRRLLLGTPKHTPTQVRTRPGRPPGEHPASARSVHGPSDLGRVPSLQQPQFQRLVARVGLLPHRLRIPAPDRARAPQSPQQRTSGGAGPDLPAPPESRGISTGSRSPDKSGDRAQVGPGGRGGPPRAARARGAERAPSDAERRQSPTWRGSWFYCTESKVRRPWGRVCAPRSTCRLHPSPAPPLGIPTAAPHPPPAPHTSARSR